MAERSGGKKQSRRDDDELVIPMKRISPAWYLIGAGLIGGVAVLFALLSGSEQKGELGSRASAVASGEIRLTKAQLQERRRHMEITQKSLAAMERDGLDSDRGLPAPPSAMPLAQRFASPPKVVEQSAAAKSSGGAVASPAPAPKKPQKQLDDLDSLGADIASQLE